MYKSVIYTITKHNSVLAGNNGYHIGTTIEVFGHTIYDNTFDDIFTQTKVYDGQKDRIVAIVQNVNFAWGYQNSGTFIDSLGNLYSFNIPDESTYSCDKEFIEYLNDIYNSTDPQSYVQSEKINQFIDYGEKIDPNSEVSEKYNEMCDYGQKNVYYITSDNDMLLLYSYGDYTIKRKDKNAESAMDEFNTFNFIEF